LSERFYTHLGSFPGVTAQGDLQTLPSRAFNGISVWGDILDFERTTSQPRSLLSVTTVNIAKSRGAPLNLQPGDLPVAVRAALAPTSPSATMSSMPPKLLCVWRRLTLFGRTSLTRPTCYRRTLAQVIEAGTSKHAYVG
jgi:hypothetical protein